MKSHLLASLLLLAAPVLARDSACTTPCPPTPPARSPVAVKATRSGKANGAASLPAHHTYAVAPSEATLPAKPTPAPRAPVKTARPGYLFM